MKKKCESDSVSHLVNFGFFFACLATPYDETLSSCWCAHLRRLLRRSRPRTRTRALPLSRAAPRLARWCPHALGTFAHSYQRAHAGARAISRNLHARDFVCYFVLATRTRSFVTDSHLSCDAGVTRMAPPHFLDETAYANCKTRFDRSDAQNEGNRTYSLWFAAHLKTAEHRFDETNPTHMFGATYQGVKYDTTMVDATGSFLCGPASLVASFYKWLVELGTAGVEGKLSDGKVLVDGKPRLYSQSAVETINRFIQGEVNAQRIARLGCEANAHSTAGVDDWNDKGFLSKRVLDCAHAHKLAAKFSSMQKIAAPEDNLKCYDVEITREQATQIAFNLLGNKEHTADLDVTVHASQRLSAQCGVRSQTNKTIGCSSVELALSRRGCW